MSGNFKGGPNGPAYHGFAITPHDTNAITPQIKAFRADAAGAVVMRLVDSSADITLNMLAGEYFFGLVSHIRATGTDAIVLHGFA